MISRRSLLVGGLAAPLAVAAAHRTAAARRPALAGKVFSGRLADTAGRDTRPLLLRGGHVVLGSRLVTNGGRVFSISNANDRYVAVVQLAEQPKNMPFLVLDQGVVRAESWGSGFGGDPANKGGASFHLDPALADEVARLWHTTRRDRTPLGAGLTGVWKPRGRFVVGRPMEVMVTLTNRGAVPVWFNVGGRQRGARDNRFRFEVSQNGKQLPVIDAPDFGGMGGYQSLAPGASLERSADLASWVEIAKAGTYQLRCRYELELVASKAGSPWPEHGHETWDWASDGMIRITVG